MKNWLSALAAIIVIILLHLPFINSDPDTKVDVNTRGAWTDEGLYASQARNYLNGYGFDVEENTTAVRGPLQVALQLQAMHLLGQERWVLRSMTLLLLLISVVLLALASRPLMALVFGILAMLQFHIFQFSHYAMAEMMAISVALISAASLAWMVRYRYKAWYVWLTLGTAMITAAVAFKIQYAYLFALVPATIWIFSIGANGEIKSRPWVFRLVSLLLVLLASGLYYGFWILPHLEYFRQVMGMETDGRYGESLSQIYEIAHYNVRNSILISELLPLLLLSGLSVLLMPFLRKKADPSLWMIAVFALIWILLELHKLPMRYIPYRYLLSLFAAMALLSSSVIIMLWQRKDLRNFLLIPALGIVAAWNLYYNYLAYERRTDEIDHANSYLKECLPEEAVVIGPWAPSLTWGTDARVIPVWDSYAPEGNLLSIYKPTLVIGEFNQADSDSAYARRGINLEAQADSIWEFRLWRMKLKGYWMREELGD